MKVIMTHKRRQKRFIFVVLAIFISLYLFLAQTSFAAMLSHEVEENRVKKEIKVTFLLDPLGDTLNAFEGSLIYDTKKLIVGRIETDNSLVTNWITTPERDNSPSGDNSIFFEGLTPGGFAGVFQNGENKREAGPLFSVIFSVKAEGEASISLSGMKVYKNDGEGTEAETLDYSATLTLSPAYLKSSYFVPSLPSREEGGDSDDYIFAQIMSMDEVYGGKPFLIFENKNKQKSLATFQISETVRKNPSDSLDFSWTEAKSPYLLTGGSLSQYVHVKAMYSDGTYKIKTLDTVEKSETSEQIYYILGLCLLLFAIFLYVFRHKKEKS